MKCVKCSQKRFSIHGNCGVCGALAPAAYNGTVSVAPVRTAKKRNFEDRAMFGTVVKERGRRIAA